MSEDRVRSARLEVQLLALVLGRPRLNGFLMVVGGVAVAVGDVLLGVLTGGYDPYFIPAGLAVSGAGLWLLVVPVPTEARARLLGHRRGSGVRWVLWQLGLGSLIFLGAGAGIYLFLGVLDPITAR